MNQVLLYCIVIGIALRSYIRNSSALGRQRALGHLDNEKKQG
jgi:hypothetical protein